MRMYLSKLRQLLITTAVLFAGFSVLLPAVSSAVSHTPKDQICAGVNAGRDDQCGDPGASNTVNDVVKLALNVFSVVVGIIAVFMIIIAGVKYITSSGESSNVAGAKNTLIYALVGIIVVALAQSLVRFVLDRTI